MDTQTFLTSIGWPTDRMNEAGQARWSGASADEFSSVQATISCTPRTILARVDRLGLEATENLLTIEATVASGQVTLIKIQAGEPPEAIPAEDAVHLFTFMSKGLADFKFISTGPLDLRSRQQARS